ncbi:MAG: HD domain-containing protein [Candidatus Gottesmanbacteria bacterium]|nr:HD domain-containing protein [Candidatus Gottesmanbacteria bacterium]
MRINKITNLVYEAAVVKRMQRTGWQILGDNEEGVGEHTFMTSVIAYFLAKEISGTRPGLEAGVNMETVLVMSVFHDFHEARTGDLDKIATFYMTRDQDKANRDIFAGIDDELLTTLNTYEEKETLEAKIVYEANVIAFLVELKLLEEKGNTHAREWLDGNLTRLRLPEAIELAKDLASSDSHDWWKNLRATLHEEFLK